MALAIYNSWVVVACVSNSFHLPDSPVNHAFIFALDKKQPGVRPIGPVGPVGPTTMSHGLRRGPLHPRCIASPCFCL